MSLELAGLLVTSGAVSPGVIDDALRRQVLAGGAFDTALLEAGATLPEAECLRALEQASSLPGINAANLLKADPSAAALLPAKLAERHCLLPLYRDGNLLHVAVPFPISRTMLQEIGFLLKHQLKPWVAIEARLREAIARVYQVPLAPRYATLIEMLGPSAPGPLGAPPPPLPEPVVPAAALVTRPPRPVLEVIEEPPALAPEKVEAARPFEQQVILADDGDSLESALERVIEAAERDPAIISRRAAPRDRVEAAGLASKIVVAGGGTPAEPLEKWTFGKAKVALESAFDRHAIIGVTLRFALKTFDFAAAFAVVGGNAVGWTALTAEGFVPERVERVSLPLDAPSVLRTVLFTHGMFLGPIPADPISQQLVLAMGRPQPLVAFVCPIEVRDRPVAILYADSSGRTASNKRVAELVAFAQLLGRRLERLILENKRKLTGTVTAAPAPPATIEPVQESAEVVEPPPPAAAPLPEILPAEEPVRVEVPPLAEPVNVEEEPTQVAELPVDEPVKVEQEPTQVAELPVEEPIKVEQEPTQVVEMPMEEPVKVEQEPTLVAEVPVEVPIGVVVPPAEMRPAPVPAKVAKAPRRRAPAASGPPDKYEYIPAPAVPPPPVLTSFVIDSPGPTAAEIFARSPARPKRSSGSATSGPALPTMEPMLAPGVSRMAVPSMAAPPSPQELHLAADKLIGTDLAERVRALGVLMRAPDVAAAVLATRFPGPLLRARVPLTELPAAEELGPVPAALARMGPAAARALLPLIENRDADCRYFALLTAGCAPSPAVIGAIAEKVFDKQPLVANAARVALAAQRGVSGFADAVTRVRHGLSVKDAETAICATKALGPLHDLLAMDKLIELTGSEERPVAQAASDALREITKQTLGTNPTRWTAWWEQNQERPRAAWLVEALRHRELDIRLSAIDELVRAVNDNFGYYADGPKAERDQAVGRWIDWLCNEGSKTPIE